MDLIHFKWLQPLSPLSAAPVPVGRRIPPSQREQKSGSGHKAAHCPQNTKGLPTTNEDRQVFVKGLKLTCICKTPFSLLEFIVTRWAAKDCILSRRASEVKYWTHLSTSDWGRDASSCRSSSSADKPWEKKFRWRYQFTRRGKKNVTILWRLTSSKSGSDGLRRKNRRSTWRVRAKPTAVRWSITCAAVWYWYSVIKRWWRCRVNWGHLWFKKELFATVLSVIPCQWWFSASSCTAWSLTALSVDFVLFSKTHNATSCGSASTWLKWSEIK